MLRTRLLGQLGCSRWRSGLARSPPPRPPHSCPRRAGGGAAQLTWPFGAGPPATRGSGGGGGTRGAGKGLYPGAWPELPPLQAPPPPVPGALPRLARALPPSSPLLRSLPPSPIAQAASFPNASASSSLGGAREGQQTLDTGTAAAAGPWPNPEGPRSRHPRPPSHRPSSACGAPRSPAPREWTPSAWAGTGATPPPPGSPPSTAR